MKITYDVSVDDFVAFNVHYCKTSPSIKRRRIVWSVVVPTCLLLLAIIDYANQKPFRGVVVAAILIAIFYPLTFNIILRRSARRQCQENANKGLIGQHELEITDTGITERTCVGTQTVTWEGIERIENTPTHGYIYVGTANAHIIPIKSVTNGNFQEFMAEVRKRKGNKP